MEPKDTTMEPQGHSKSTKSRPNVRQGWQNGPPGATTEPQGWQNGAPRSPKVLKRRHKVSQSATKTLKCGPRCQKNDIPTYRHISSKIHDIFFKCRRQCFAHQYELLRNRNLEIGVYICQKEKKRKMCTEVCARGFAFLPWTVHHGSILGRNRFWY
jgi:hypothetical protein